MIHPTAIISSTAQLGEGVSIGPYAIVEDHAVIGKGTQIGPFARICAYSKIGENNEIHSHVVIGDKPQDHKYKGELSWVEIGNGNTFRESVTIQRSTGEGNQTIIGNNNYFMVSSHVAHNCIVGNNNTFANCVPLGGHSMVENNIIFGGLSAVHQFCRVGSYAFVGGLCPVVKDIPPFMLAAENPCRVIGLNGVGLKRNNFPEETRSAIKKAYRYLYRSHIKFSEAIHLIEKELGHYPEIQHLLTFISESKRGLIGH